MDNRTPLPPQSDVVRTDMSAARQQQSFTDSVPSSVVVGHFIETAPKTSHLGKLHRLAFSQQLIIIVAVLLLGGGITFGLSELKHNAGKPTVTEHKTQKTKPSSTAAPPTNTPVASNSGATPKPSPTPVTSKNAKSVTQAPSSSPAIPSPATCTSGSYQPAGALNISTSSPGLKQQIDAPTYYEVYGYTGAQIRSELNQCTPVKGGAGDFDSETTWWTNYTYNYYTTAGGSCAMSSVAVGEHISFVYPKWTDSPYAAAGLNSQWQTYISHLTTHETGHQSLVLQYANSILSGLQNFVQSDCSTMVQAANSWADSQIAALNQANVNYDAQTGHGATQGATFP
jgi:predicted secreted Zn-dependent protease